MTDARTAQTPPPEPVAIVGVGCRYPGGAHDLPSLGHALESGRGLVRDVPEGRWGRYPDGTPTKGVFFDDVARFDAEFFGIAPPEASLLDPQQRLLLEVAWEAMSDAGRTREQWRGTRTGVFVGMLAGDYHLLHARTLGTAGVDQHYVSGVEFSFAAGRLAYTFDLQGPALAVNSACSSSLLAVHQACQSLRGGDCDTALAAGVSLLITPDISVFMHRVGALSATGSCRPFDAAADGTVRGEGCGVVVLKRLTDALADGDRVHGVLRGSAANNDGASMGLTAPNPAAQARLLRDALAHAGIGPADVDYVEAHGTGTHLGDMYELGVLDEVYGTGREPGRPLRVGSLKAVLGHTDAAAGITGLLKALWVVGSGRAPAQPGIDSLHPAVDWAAAGIAVPLDHTELTAPGRPLRAGVSAFGLSGTNVHAVVEAATEDPEGVRPGHAPYLLLASAARPEGLAAQVAGLREHAARTDRIGDLIASAATRRTHEAHRYAAVAMDVPALLDGLDDPEEPPDGAYMGAVPDPDSAPAPVFVYPGQGGQWAGMAMDLHATDPVFRATLDECDALLRADGMLGTDGLMRTDGSMRTDGLVRTDSSWSLTEEMRRTGHSRLDRTDISHCAIFAVQVAVTRWLAERGVRPAAVIGHSLGEITAAHVAGVLSLADAMRLVLVRSTIARELAAGSGLMYAVQGGADTVAAALAETGLAAAVAAVNGPASCVFSGPTEDAVAAADALEARGLRCRRLKVELASHGPAVAHCGPPLREAAAGLDHREATLRWLSTVDPDRDLTGVDADYWARNITRPVLLWPAVDRLLAEQECALVEVGPHPVLTGALTDALRHRGRAGQAHATLHRDEPGGLALHRTLARLHVDGVPIDWENVTGRPGRYHSLPVPTWGGDRYWLPTGQRPRAEDTYVRPLPSPVPRERAAGTGGSALSARVETAVREVLGLPDGQRLLRRRGLFEQGLDSLSAATLRRRLDRECGVTLPVPAIFEHPTVEALVAYLAELGAREVEDGEAVQEAGPAEPPAEAALDGGPGAGDEEDAGAAIAVTGISCRLPGAGSPQEFWELLTAGRDSVSEPPPGRRDDPVWAEAAAADIPSRSCYLDDIAGFDAGFFRISPREAASLDPQQRLMLEVAWEALEDAGSRPAALTGRPVGVYVGLEAADYQQLLARDMRNVDLYFGTGTSFAAVAGRLSYVLGLSGPSLVVDTACSASLTAVHLACQGLRGGDCEVAVVGGAHTMIAPTLMVAMSESGALAADGWCKTFDEDADGYGVGEGAVALVLKPLAAARRDGDRVYAVIRGSAVNQDGAAGGFTVPNAAAQQALIRRALDRAGWQPADVDYVEAHGTGTPVGDPIEVNALAEAYGPGRAPDAPLVIGSAKPNVGHLAAAAGVVGLLKTVLSLHHGRIPRHLVNRPSSRIDWAALPVELATTPRPWPRHGRPARAGVSSFGLTGTNAHVLLEQATERPDDDTAGPHRPARPYPRPCTRPYALPVTAASARALRTAALRMARHLRETDPGHPAHPGLDALVGTATHRRSLLEHRIVAVGADAEELAAALESAAAGGDAPAATAVHRGRCDAETTVTATFRYPVELPATWQRLTADPDYRRALDDCAAHLAAVTGTSTDLTEDPDPALRDAHVFCHHVAATALWAAIGVRPQHATGDGPGRLGAAWAEGRVSVREALRALCGEARQARQARHEVSGEAPDGDTVVLDVLPWDDADADADDADPLERIVHTAAELFATGYEPVPGATPVRPVSLPAYPWEHHRTHWYREPLVRRTDTAVPCVLSAPGPTELRRYATQLASFVRESPALDVDAFGAALADRPVLPCRATVVAGHRTALLTGLDALATGADAPNVITDTVLDDPSGVVMVFPGQGGQWAGMGRELLDASPVFAERVEACAAAIEPFTGWSVVDVLRGADGAPDLARNDVLQPVLFTVMVALARLWESVGVVPGAVLGHSQGEIAAACVAGALGLDDAARIVALRSRALHRDLAGRGGALSVRLSRHEVTALLERWGERLSVAAVNGPGSVVVSGEMAALDELEAVLTETDVRVRRLTVHCAAHSAQMDQLKDELLDVLAPLAPRSSDIAFCSAVTGDVVDGSGLDAAYWFRNLRETVEFEKAARSLIKEGHSVFLEVSAHPLLAAGFDETGSAMGVQITALETLRRDDGGMSRFVASLAEAHAHGVAVDWPALFTGTGPRRPELPSGQGAMTSDLTSGDDDGFWQAVETGDADELTGLLDLDATDEQRRAVEALLPALTAWRGRHRERHVGESWRYRVTWRRTPLPTPPDLTGTWLVVLPERCGADGTVARCLAALAAGGADVCEVVVDAARADRVGLAERLRTAAARQAGEVHGVVSLLAFDEEPHAAEPGVPAGLAATVVLSQALDDAEVEARLWCVTGGAVSVGADDPVTSPAQAQVLGLTRVLGLDEPRRWGGQVDVGGEPGPALCAVLAGALGDEDQVALRGRNAWVRRLTPAPLESPTPSPGRRVRGTALVTGGTGGVGAQVARRLVGAGAERVVLVSRRGKDAPGASELLAELARAGTAEIVVEACDVTDREALAGVLARIPDESPLTTVVHAAAVIGERKPLSEVTVADLAEILGPKVAGTDHLDALLGDRRLDAFVLFSSNAGVYGSSGQGPYAAANAYLDAFAERRAARGLPVTSIAWGAWAGSGGAATPDAERFLARRGVRPMPPPLALAALRQAVERGDTTLSVTDMDWPRFAESFTAARPRPLIADIPGAGGGSGAGPDQDGARGDGPGSRAAALAARLAGETTAAGRERILLDLVRGEVASVLGHDGVDAVEPDRAFKDFGFDSVTAVQMRGRLRAATGLRLSATLIFDHPTAASLARHLHGELAPDDAPGGPAHPIDAMSVQDLLRIAGNESDR
ncbi:type I polyketide synthase [Streptomyces sp. NPDC003032]